MKYTIFAGNLETKVENPSLWSTSLQSSKYHAILFTVPYHPLQSSKSPFSNYHTTLDKVSHRPLQSTTIPSLKKHTTLFKVTHHLLQSTKPSSLKYHTIVRVPHQTMSSIFLSSGYIKNQWCFVGFQSEEKICAQFCQSIFLFWMIWLTLVKCAINSIIKI